MKQRQQSAKLTTFDPLSATAMSVSISSRKEASENVSRRVSTSERLDG